MHNCWSLCDMVLDHAITLPHPRLGEECFPLPLGIIGLRVLPSCGGAVYQVVLLLPGEAGGASAEQSNAVSLQNHSVSSVVLRAVHQVPYQACLRPDRYP